MANDTPHPGLQPHCGFSNAVTWSVALFLDNDSLETLRTARQAAAHSSAALQLFVGRSKWQPEIWARVVNRGVTISHVNWAELRAHLLAE